MTTRRIPLRDLVASGPALSSRDLASLLEQEGPSGVAYDGPPRVGFPLLPVQIFGVRYDLDLVLVDRGADWDMHEYARVDTPTGAHWLCKDTVDGTLEQTIVADLDDLDHALPEVPLRRGRSKVDVVDRSDDRTLDLTLSYTNLKGRQVRVDYRGPRPKPTKPRSGSTMGHSRDHVLAVLDISHRSFAKRASITVDGEPQPLYRVLGLVPLAVVLVQTQGGFSVGAYTQSDDAGGARTRHVSGAEQAWTRVDGDDGTVTLVQRSALRTLRYVFRRDGDALELARAEAWPASPGLPPACVARFVPALPDLRRPFRGPWEGSYVLDVGGQPAHGVGKVRIDRDLDADRVHLIPTAPRWTTDRPMVATVRIADGVASVDVAREPT